VENPVFPPSFIWGTATAAYQVEGSPLADGAGPTNWHEFTHRRRTVLDGTNGDTACDHYRRCAEDVAQMRLLGTGAYRFSVGWGRVMPEPGRVNEKGIDFYERLVDSLLLAGITPWVTIFHLEEPVWLSRQGGFTKKSSVDHLEALGRLLFRRLGDRVRNWITINEPTIYAYCGYMTGEFPPGRKLALRPLLACAYHLSLAHARLCAAWQETGRDGMIGLAHHAVWVEPARADNDRDREAAAFMDDMANRTVLDPLLSATYPRRVLSRLGRFLPPGLERDIPALRSPGTYVGINYYARNAYRWSRLTPLLHAVEHRAPESSRSAMWEIFPRGLYLTLKRLQTEYGNPPCVVTENGFPLLDAPGRDPLDDPERIRYIREHVLAMGQAIAEGADCRGYFYWSLMDNFEWNLGLAMRFGLLRTDFQTQARAWKASARWYSRLVTTNALPE
jgi:beta-glucosidase